MEKLPEIIVRDFDPKKDIPNPVFKIKISNMEMTVALSQIRTIFRKHLSNIDVVNLIGKDEMQIVNHFLTQGNIQIGIKQHVKLALCFKTDISRKINNEPFGLQG